MSPCLVYHLAPRTPLLATLVKALLDASEATERLVQQVETRAKHTDRPVVCRWGRDDTLGPIMEDGTVAEDCETSVLSVWREVFLDDRKQATDML